MLPAAVPELTYENLITCGFIALALAFGLRLSFEKLEKQQLIICSILNFKLPAAYRTRPPMLAGAIVSAVILVAFAGISGWGLVGKLFGI